MPAKVQWATTEGGMAQGFPLSLNQSTDWLSLRRGECYQQDHVSTERDGVMEYGKAPPGSSDIFYYNVVRYDTPEEDLQANEIQGWEWDQKYWIEAEEGKDLVAGPSFGSTTKTYKLSGGKIRMVVEIGEWKMMILKEDRAFVFDAREQFMTTPYFGIGTSNEDSVLYTNAVWYGNAILVWKAGGTEYRHFMWDGKGPAVELSRLVREYAAQPSGWVAPTINWSRSLIIIGKLVYDMEYRRVFYYSGSTSASLTTRPYYHVHFHPILISKMAFFCNGKSGSFKATIEYGQSQDKLSKSKSFTVNITDSTKSRFRHVWVIDNPIRCRVWRLKIENLTGVGITQIDACSAIDDTPDSYDGES
jgi:hypothetical protein